MPPTEATDKHEHWRRHKKFRRKDLVYNQEKLLAKSHGDRGGMKFAELSRVSKTLKILYYTRALVDKTFWILDYWTMDFQVRINLLHTAYSQDNLPPPPPIE